jgi:plastocyanin
MRDSVPGKRRLPCGADVREKGVFMRRFPLLIVICAFAAFGLAACGGDDNKDTTTQPATTEPSTTETTTGGGGKTVQVAADPSGALAFEQKSLTAPVGKVTFGFTNESSTPHDFVLERDGQEVAKTPVFSGGKRTTQATLEAGKYTYFCSVPGHRQAGMEGTLTAK